MKHRILEKTEGHKPQRHFRNEGQGPRHIGARDPLPVPRGKDCRHQHRYNYGDDQEMVLADTGGDEAHRNGEKDSRHDGGKNRPPGIEAEIVSADVKAVAPGAEEYRLGKGQHAAETEHQGKRHGEQTPDQNLGDEDLLVIGHQPRKHHKKGGQTG